MKQSKPLAPKRKRKPKGLKIWVGGEEFDWIIEPDAVVEGKKLKEFLDSEVRPFSAVLANEPITKEFFAKDGTKLTLVMPGLL